MTSRPMNRAHNTIHISAMSAAKSTAISGRQPPGGYSKHLVAAHGWHKTPACTWQCFVYQLAT